MKSKLGNKGAKIIISIFFLGLLVVAGWLLYQNYLKPQYRLADLVPNNALISFQFNLDRLAFPKIQQQKLLSNAIINQIYGQLSDNFNAEKQKLNSGALAFLQKTNQVALFWQTADQYALLIKLPPKTDLDELKKMDFSPWQSLIIKNQILALSNNDDLLNTIANQKISLKSSSYFSLSIEPWLTAKITPEFFSASYQNDWLNLLQQIIKPLDLKNGQNYLLAVKPGPYDLKITVKPAQTQDIPKETDLHPWLNQMLNYPDLVIGVGNLKAIQQNVNSSEKLKQLWDSLGFNLWLANQISLNDVIKNVQGPVLYSQNKEQWEIELSSANQKLAEKILQNYLGQFWPKEKTKVLPDKTRSVELLAQPDLIKFTQTQQNGWQIFTYPAYQDNPNLGYAIKGDFLLISNNVNRLNLKKPVSTCYFNDQPSAGLSQYLTFKPGNFASLPQNIKEFLTISAFGYNDGEIRLCIGLK